MTEETSKSLVNIDFAKPMTRLVDAIASGIGTLYEPTKIRKLAQANADAEAIRANSEIAKLEIVDRARQRVAYTEIKRQEIIEKIIAESAKILAEKASTVGIESGVDESRVDESWAMNFFDNCKDVSDEEVQKIWGKILAGEVESPGSFHRKTINLLKNLDSNDAKLISRLGNSCWVIGNRLLPIITEEMKSGLSVGVLNYEDFLHLDALGIINFNQSNDFTLKASTRKVRAWHEHWHRMEFPTENFDFIMGSVALTVAGAQIIRVTKREFNAAYFDHVIKVLSSFEISLSSEFPRRVT